MSEEIKELLFLLHNDRLTEAGKRKLEQEIEKLNNIINELEKWLNKWKSLIDKPDEFEDGIISCIVNTLDKIKELKGSDK